MTYNMAQQWFHMCCKHELKQLENEMATYEKIARVIKEEATTPSVGM